MRTLAIALIALAACSSHPPRDTTTGGGGGAAPPPDAAPGTTAADAGATAAALTRADCEQMIDHILEIGMAEQRANKPPEQVPTPEQVAEIRATLLAELLDECLTFDRPSYDCVMGATTSEGLEACTGGA